MEFLQEDIPSVQDLLHSGDPFVAFSEFSVQTLQAQPEEDISRWIENKLRDGRPFVIRGFSQTDEWRKAALNNDSLVSFSASGAIPVRNCQTGRDVRMRLRDLLSQTDHARTGNVRESLYAKDLHCPQEWVKTLETFLPSSLRHLGSLDLFRVLPKETAPEVLMAYVGTRRSFSGFHRCFSATIALNLLIESEGTGPGSICFGTDRNSQDRYDFFMEELGKSAHTDWANVSVNKLRSADFPIYVTDQRPGDLVVFPTATAHQIWNISSMVTKVVWNIMHATSLASFFHYVQPAYQKQCHADTGRVPLIPTYALQSGACGREENNLLLGVFRQLVEDEDTGKESLLRIKTVDTQGAVVECNFCGLTIWNRHLHCEKCGDFDLCLTCFVSGRSCKHVADYTWAEMLPRGRCQDIIQAAGSRIDVRALQKSRPSSQKASLGALVVAAMGARQQLADRLCHLCRDSHPAWKGMMCTQCTAFFCFRGLHRHFDIDLIPFLKTGDSWLCPKCSQICNCRCCHFPQPYQSKDKPVRARIKPIDPRGRILGFVDNVFDQKRGKRASLVASPQPSDNNNISPSSPRGSKRPRIHTENEEPGKSPWGNGASIPVISAGPSRHRSDVSEVFSSTNVATPTQDRNSASIGYTPSRTFDPLGPFRSDKVESQNPLAAAPGQSSSSRPTHYPYLPPPSSYSVSQDETVPRGHTNSRDDSKAEGLDLEEDIRVLERKLAALRGYADDLLELSLVESHAKILERIVQFEAEIEQRKRRKAEVLLSNLNRDFPDLADLAREEARRRGL
ncbi:hypothetical protein BDW59DRAFT_177975 [Aspergillus cavernicola]|uniref:JmjC domain-containing protein n=1 Tax=Aspergillus cavernicola TaxID=176166 RepID=A0ABR4HFH6_9EURO